MPFRITALSLILIPMFVSDARADQPAAEGNKIDPAHIRKLIENLGSSSFGERDQASKDLEAIGPAALDQLRKEIKSTDPELVSRVASLVGKLEEKALTASLLSPRRVRLKVTDMSVIDAVTELQKLSGQQLDVPGDRTGLAARKITLDTGDVSIWEALQQLCEKGGMTEQVSMSRPNQSNMPVYRSPHLPVSPNRSIVLVDSTQKLPPTCFAGSVRVRALPAQSAGAPLPGQVNVVLEVVGEQRLQSFSIVDALFFEKSTDEQGQRLQLLAENPFANQGPYFNPNINRVMIVNGNVVPIGGSNAVLQRTSVFRFQPGQKGSKTMKELSGKLVLQALGPVENLVVIKDARKPAGYTAKGKDGNAIQVLKADNLENGSLRLEVTIESPPEGGATQNPFGNNVMVLNGNFNGNINGVQFVNGVPAGMVPTNYPKLVDAKGTKYAPEVSNSRPKVSNGQVLRHVTLTYRPEGEASQLVLEGQRTILFAVPIILKDIPLQ